MIKKIEISDTAQLTLFIEQCFHDTHYDNLGHAFSRKDTHESIETILKNNNASAYVYKENDTILGAIGFVIDFQFTNCSALTYSEIIWHALPSLSPYRRIKIMVHLLDHFLEIHDQKNIKNYDIFVNSKNKNLFEKILLKRGFYESEIIYRRAI